METKNAKGLLVLAQFVTRLESFTNKLLLLLTILLSAAGFAWALYGKDVVQLAAACAFPLLVLWPVVRMGRSNSTAVKQSEVDDE